MFLLTFIVVLCLVIQNLGFQMNPSRFFSKSLIRMGKIAEGVEFNTVA